MRIKAKIEYYGTDEKVVAVFLSKMAERVVKTTGAGIYTATAIFSTKNDLDNFVAAANLKSHLGVTIARTRRLLL